VKQTTVRARIRQLCCLGLPGELLITSLLPALRELVPSDSAGFFWVDSRGDMTNLYAERLLPAEVMSLYFERFYDGLERYTPDLISWNGSGFDLPVLHYRSMRHNVVAPRYWEMGEEDASFKWNNYLNRFHWRRSSAESPITCSNAPASASGSRGGVSIPFTPSSTTSALPPTSVSTIGRPAAVASRSTRGSPSHAEDMT
jgi:hypothetical protein